MKTVFKMKMIFYKMYYSILYLVHKNLRSQSKKSGSKLYKSYVTNAIQFISLPFVVTLFISLQMLGIKNVSRENIGLGAIIAGFLFILLLNATLSKKKMLKYRFIFSKSKKYAFLYVMFLIALITFSFIYSKIIN